MLLVARDYAKFLVENDGVSFKEAMDGMTLEDVEVWFSQQYSWDDVDHQGKLIKYPSEQEILDALDMARRDSGAVSSVSEKRQSERQMSKIKRRKLQATIERKAEEPTHRSGPKF